MRHDTAPCRLLVWLAAAVVGWAVVLGVCLYFPESLIGLAVAGFLLWRKGQRPVPAPLDSPVLAVRVREDARRLVVSSV